MVLPLPVEPVLRWCAGVVREHCDFTILPRHHLSRVKRCGTSHPNFVSDRDPASAAEDRRRAGHDPRGDDMTDVSEMGPIDYIVVEFPEDTMTGEGLTELVDLVDRGLIRLLDLAFVHKAADGSVSGLALADLDGDGELDLAVFDGVSSGLIDDDDVNEAGSVLEPGSSAGILVYENTWAAPFAVALRRAGAQLVASGRIPVQAMLASLEAAESRDAPTASATS
jgi:hypothetical protein